MPKNDLERQNQMVQTKTHKILFKESLQIVQVDFTVSEKLCFYSQIHTKKH